MKLFYALSRSKLGFKVKSALFFKGESVENILDIIHEQFNKDIEFNNNVLKIIKDYPKIVFLTGSPVEVARTVLNKLPYEIKIKSEIIGMALETENGVYTGKVKEHPFCCGKRKFVKIKAGKTDFDGIGNSFYDIPFLQL